MRLFIKLGLLIAMAVGIQMVINASGGPLDRAHFVFRVGMATMCGKAPGDPMLVEAATQLRMREFERDMRELRAS